MQSGEDVLPNSLLVMTKTSMATLHDIASDPGPVIIQERHIHTAVLHRCAMSSCVMTGPVSEGYLHTTSEDLLVEEYPYLAMCR